MLRASRSERDSTTHDLRHGRTARLLEARLEALASAREHSLTGERPLDLEVLRTAAATRNAIQLNMLSPEEAGAIWAGVAKRHPGLSWRAAGPEL